MITGIMWAVAAGVMLGLYALPEKFTKGSTFENTWSVYFLIALFIVPIISCFSLIDGFGDILCSMDGGVIAKMAIASILWGVGVTMWGKAINYIGLSLGFSIFIGTVILVGSLIPFAVDGLPASNVLTTILIGIVVVLIGVIANGRAGMIRAAHEKDNAEVKAPGKSMGKGIAIAIIGGLLATGFSYANAVGGPSLLEGVTANGNPEWMNSIAIMFVIYVSAGFVVIPYFIYMIQKQKSWGNFKNHVVRNLSMAAIMGIFNFAASAVFAYAAYSLGSEAGNTVGYAIYNTTSVAFAIVSGLLTKEWTYAPKKAHVSLYAGLFAMIIGVIIIAYGNSLS